jgi:hypothetical protein
VSAAAWWLLGGVVLLVVVILLEGKRQERIYGKSGRGGIVPTALLELQRHLEPERRVETMIEKRDETEQDDAGESPPRAP